jgi:molybdate transport system ATP-binding protein
VKASELRLAGRVGAFSLDVAAAFDERVGVVVGASGAGKSTLLAAILGFEPRVRGTIRIAGEWLEDPARGLRIAPERRGLGWVPQAPSLFPHLDVAGNVSFGLRRGGDAGRRLVTRALEVLELGPLLRRRVDTLSGGEAQRVALARALASAPRALLLDEPLASLDLPLRARALAYLLRLRDEVGIPMLWVTHDPDEAMCAGEIALVLDAGRVVAVGPPREVLWSRAVAPLADVLGVENVLEAHVVADTGPPGGTSCRARTRAGLELVLPQPVEPGVALRLGLRAEEILLATGSPGRLSARNVLEATVVGIDDDGARARVSLLASGEPLVARLTSDAARSLGLAPGLRVQAIVKAQALRRLA